MVRIFSHHGENRSRNLCTFTSNPNVQDAGRRERAPQPPWAERVYQHYAEFCATLGVPPQAFENWRTDDYGITKADIEDRIQRAKFYGYDAEKPNPSAFRFHPLHSNLSTAVEPPRRDWSGSWDNAVKLVEDARAVEGRRR